MKLLRKAGTERYPDYEHETTREGRVAQSANRLREFVFIRKASPYDRSTTPIKIGRFGDSYREYYVKDTDNEDSSDSDVESLNYNITLLKMLSS